MFENKVALVTGGGRGIGRAIASAFAAQRAHVIVNDILPKKELSSIANSISKPGLLTMRVSFAGDRSKRSAKKTGTRLLQ